MYKHAHTEHSNPDLEKFLRLSAEVPFPDNFFSFIRTMTQRIKVFIDMSLVLHLYENQAALEMVTLRIREVKIV